MQATVISFTKTGGETAERIREALPDWQLSLCALPKFAADNGQIPVTEGLSSWCRTQWQQSRLLIFVGACGIAVRLIAPLLNSKASDPAVLVIDEQGTFVIPLCSGHLGGGNGFASLIASRLDAIPVVTTATDLERRFSVDLFARQNRLEISSLKLAKDISAAILAGERIPVSWDETIEVQGKIPPELKAISLEEAEREDGLQIVISPCKWPVHTRKILWLIPRSVTLGLGCRKDLAPEILLWQADHWLAEAGIFQESLRQAATIDRKREEPAVLALTERKEIPLVCYTAEQLMTAEGDFRPSAFVESVTGADNVCERAASLASGGGILLMPKQAGSGVTAAAAAEKTTVRFTP